MLEISVQSLMVAVKLIEERSLMLSHQMQTLNEDDEELPDIVEELYEVSKARAELKATYVGVYENSDNLPAWQDLIAGLDNNLSQ